MTAPLPQRKRNAVLRMFFEGMSYDLTARHAGVAKGSVEEIIRRLKSGEHEEYQDVHDIVDSLREIAVFVKKHFAGDLDRCHVGSVAWVGLSRLGVDPAKVPEWARMCDDLATSDVSPREVVEIALWCRRLQDELGVALPDLPQRLESLKGELNSLLAEQRVVEPKVQAANASLASQREALGLLQDIEGLRSARQEEESRLAEAQCRARAELTAAEVTSEGLEQFRVFVGTAKAKDVPVNGPLFDTLLTLVVSLGPQGIREVNTLRELLAKEGRTASEGATLLKGLWRKGFTLKQAADVAGALGTQEPFPAALSRLMSLLHQYGSLPAAAAASNQRMQELRRIEDAQHAESTTLARNLAVLRKENEDLAPKLQEASGQLEQVRGEIRKALSDFEACADGRAAELRRVEGMREGCFDELADRITKDDYALLGTHVMKKVSQGPADPVAQWIWGLMSDRERHLLTPRLASDGTPINGPDGAPVEETFVITLSREERHRLRRLLHEAMQEHEGPFHALERILSGDVKGPPKPGDGGPDLNAELPDEFLRRINAATEFRHMTMEVINGKRRRSVPLRVGTPAGGTS